MKKASTQFALRPAIWLALLIVAAIGTGCEKKRNEGDASQALSTFELEDGFKIELIAAEPLISDPVDMEIDEYGRLYVVEMHGYPLDKSGSGKIKVLTDTDKDGTFDKSTVFAEGLVLPNSIMRWKKGVIVTDAPHVLYFEDADGDNRAEIMDTLLTGFALSNPQHNLNSPILALDNWIYLAHESAVGTETYKEEFGDRGQEIFFPDHPQSPRLRTNAGGRAVRFKPGTHALEETSSYSQFGHTFDAWGHHLQVGNANHIFHEVIAEKYLSRNPDLAISDATESLSDHGDAAEVFPITLKPEHQLLTDIGVITSACGLTAYLGAAFPPPYDSVTFVAEPVSNLVHVDRLKNNGTTFTARRIREHKEFLASLDARFRPVNMYVGPDGALYIVDYYRQIIEHPEWMGDEVVKSGALYNDTDKGRIYRISPENSTAADWIKGLSLGDATDEALVELLGNANIWWRLNAQRLLIDRAAPGTVPFLVEMSRNNSSPMGRLHALWTLEGLNKLEYDQLEKALHDPVAGIRENAVKLAEIHMADMPLLKKNLLQLENDPDVRVRFQLLCTLGDLDTPEAVATRRRLLFRDIGDNWVQVAALSAASTHTVALLKSVIDNFPKDDPAYTSLIKKLAMMAGAKADATVSHDLIQKAATPRPGVQQNWQAAVLDGLAEGLRTNGTSLAIADQQLLAGTFFEHPSPQLRRSSLNILKAGKGKNDAVLESALTKALSVARDTSVSEDKRADAIDFLSIRNPAPYTAFLREMFIPTEDLSVQLAALRTMSVIPDTTLCHYLLKQWTTFTPEIREAAVRTFLTNDERVAILLRSIGTGTVNTTDLTWPQKVRLMAQSNDKLRDQARTLFTKNSDREINEAYSEALTRNGDAIEGKNIYQAQCALCHQIRGKLGITLGPDLGTIHSWSKEAIMANILAPGQSISSGYDLWNVDLKNGESFQGLIATETPGAISFKNSGMTERMVKRQDIKQLKALGMSAMPTGLEKQLSLQQMADLLAFLKENK